MASVGSSQAFQLDTGRDIAKWLFRRFPEINCSCRIFDDPLNFLPVISDHF
jgi:hypothetical protein